MVLSVAQHNSPSNGLFNSVSLGKQRCTLNPQIPVRGVGGAANMRGRQTTIDLTLEMKLRNSFPGILMNPVLRSKLKLICIQLL